MINVLALVCLFAAAMNVTILQQKYVPGVTKKNLFQNSAKTSDMLMEFIVGAMNVLKNIRTAGEKRLLVLKVGDNQTRNHNKQKKRKIIEKDIGIVREAKPLIGEVN